MFEQLISKRNLLLAWRRITTSGNYQYKRFYRNLYSIYEVALEENIDYLYHRLKANTFTPHPSIRTYLPKPSGLQRPIILLFLEDQIVLQAFANLLVEKLREKRLSVEKKAVFSNYLNTPGNIFFVKPWRYSYREYREVLIKQFTLGFRWVAHFDLAAFYDTISHELLIKQLCPRSQHTDIYKFLKRVLSTWTSSKETASYSHGVPQGPSASDLLAECFLLSIDLEMMRRKHKYFRYVDDIRLFGSDETEVRKAAIDLELLCRERGLIPQSSKHSILKARKTNDILGNLPSINELDILDNKNIKFLTKKAERIFVKSLNETKNEIIEKAHAKYVLYRAPKSRLILKFVLRLLPHQPEYIDAYISFLTQYHGSKRVKNLFQKLLLSNFPYDYVNGELWRFLSKDIDKKYPAMKELAVDTVSSGKGFASQLGAAIFLSEYDKAGYGEYSNFLKYQPSLLQAFAAEHIPVSKLQHSPLVSFLLSRTNFEVSMALIREFMLHQIDPTQVGISIDQLAQQSKNVIKKIGFGLPIQPKIDLIGEMLVDIYRISPWGGWKSLFGADYGHALMLLRNAKSVLLSNRSEWLSLTDSFNDTLCRCFNNLLRINNVRGWMNTIDRRGILIDFGNLITPNSPFDRSFSSIANNLRVVHTRRSQLPSSHPYDKHTGAKAKFLKKKEQPYLMSCLSTAYTEVIQKGLNLGLN